MASATSSAAVMRTSPTYWAGVLRAYGAAHTQIAPMLPSSGRKMNQTTTALPTCRRFSSWSAVCCLFAIAHWSAWDERPLDAQMYPVRRQSTRHAP